MSVEVITSYIYTLIFNKNLLHYCINTFFLYFCICISLAEARYGLCGRVQYFIEKRLLTLFLGFSKSGKFQLESRMKQW